MSSGDIDHELEHEQRYVATLYALVDAQREAATTRLDSGADATVWRNELARLDGVEQGLCFGRLDMRDGRRVYIGRLSLFRDEDRDAEPLLVDWRAPAAGAFYTATAAEPHGVRRRRRITTRGRTVVALDDELLDPDDTGDSGLVGEAALMAALTAQRTGRMHDIVTTLQAEQDRIIRHETRGTLVVQGGPGTGKTAVALHRVAYLLYTRPHLRTRGALVVGPSQIFLDYIGQVLPGLGENRVVTATVTGLWPGIEPSRVDSPAAAERKGRAVMAERLAEAVRTRIRMPEEPVELEFEEQALTLDLATCRRAARRARQAGLPHNQAGLVFQREVVDALAQRLADAMEALVLTDTGEALDGGSADGRLGAADLRALAAAGVVLGDDDDEPRSMLDATDRTRLRDALLADDDIRSTLDTLWPPLTAAQVVSDFLDEPAGGWSAADVPLLDEAATLVGENVDRPVYAHVVVDEAQELSEMAWRMVMRRCPSRSMTIVGDLAQTGSTAGASSWGQVLGPHLQKRWQQVDLTVNYRTPAEIMAATEELLAAHHPGMPVPRSVRSAGVSPWRIGTTRHDLPVLVADLAASHTGGQLAIIALEALTTALSGTDAVVLTPSEAKGLEFDSVLIVDPHTILDATPLGANDLYVAMTRATQRLGIVHLGPPPAELAAIAELDRSAFPWTSHPAGPPRPSSTRRASTNSTPGQARGPR